MAILQLTVELATCATEYPTAGLRNVTDQAATLRLAVFPRSGLLTDALLVLGGAAFVGLMAQLSYKLHFTPVPLTGQTFAVLLVGAAYGPALGAASMVAYALLGIVGVPLYADHTHGWSSFTGNSGGYIVGFVLAAAVTGWLSERGWDKRFSSSIALDAHRQRRDLPLRRDLAAPRAARAAGRRPSSTASTRSCRATWSSCTSPRPRCRGPGTWSDASAASGGLQHRELIRDLERPRAEAVERRRAAA